MNLYFAPLEGITTYVYRNTHAEIFGGCDAYYTPFITPSDNEKISRKGLRDVIPERNEKGKLVVQVLTNRADSFLKFERKIKALGYREININLGCPFERVVKKGRGAGMLADTEALDRFLDGVFAGCDLAVSVKTRTGFYSGAEMERLTEIYNQYPLSLLIIHPRTRADFYRGIPDEGVFAKAVLGAKVPVCYNGDVVFAEDFWRITAGYPGLEGVMIGRGVVRNPALFREIRGGKKLKTEELLAFSECLTENYYRELGSEVFTLQKLKEIWAYMLQNYPGETKIAKAIKKASSLAELAAAASRLPREINCGLKP